MTNPARLQTVHCHAFTSQTVYLCSESDDLTEWCWLILIKNSQNANNVAHLDQLSSTNNCQGYAQMIVQQLEACCRWFVQGYFMVKRLKTWHLQCGVSVDRVCSYCCWASPGWDSNHLQAIPSALILGTVHRSMYHILNGVSATFFESIKHRREQESTCATDSILDSFVEVLHEQLRDYTWSEHPDWQCDVSFDRTCRHTTLDHLARRTFLRTLICTILFLGTQHQIIRLHILSCPTHIFL